MVSDQALIRQIQKHRAGSLNADGYAAFDQLFERYESPIHWHLLKIVRSDDVAQDLLQEVFMRVWTRAEQWQGRGSFKSWLYRIATNLALNHLRTSNRRQEQPLVDPDLAEDADETHMPTWITDQATPAPGEILENMERLAQFRQLVTHLSDEKREVLRLVHEMEMSLQDTADELDLPLGTVKSRLYYARKQLSHEWDTLQEE